MLWIALTLLAAFTQAWRNAFQKQLSSAGVDVYGTTLARFLFSVPLAVGWLALLHHLHPAPLPAFPLWFGIDVVLAGLSQILATALMVRLFKLKNYAIGIGLAKSEAILAALVGVACLNETLSPLGWAGVALGGVAVFLISGGGSPARLTPGVLLTGLASGLCFAFTSLLVRQASLHLAPLPYLHRAAWVLASVITFQCLSMLAALAWLRPATLRALWQQRRLAAAVSLASFLASFGWFGAMSIQSVAIVKTLGQIEIFFSLLVSLYWFREKLARADHIGLWLIAAAALLVIWG